MKTTTIVDQKHWAEKEERGEEKNAKNGGGKGGWNSGCARLGGTRGEPLGEPKETHPLIGGESGGEKKKKF